MVAVFAVFSSVMFTVLTHFIIHELFVRLSEMEADVELGEQSRAIVQSQVTGWLVETGASEPLPE